MPTELHAKVTRLDGLLFQGENPFGVGARMESHASGQAASAPTPMELVLQAAGGCTSMDVVSILQKRQVRLTKFEVVLRGVKRDEHPRIFQSVHIVYRAQGEGLTLEALQKAAELSQEKYCSVFGILKATAAVTYECELIPG